MYDDSIGDYGRRLYITFVLDSTAGMDFACMNRLTEAFLRTILKDTQLAPTAFISFVTYADAITMESAFVRPEMLRQSDFASAIENSSPHVSMARMRAEDPFGNSIQMNFPRFRSVGRHHRTGIRQAVSRVYQKLDGARSDLLEQVENSHGNTVQFYAPAMVLITSGRGKDECLSNMKTAHMLTYDRRFSRGNASNLVIPIVCGIDTAGGRVYLDYNSSADTSVHQSFSKASSFPTLDQAFFLIRETRSKSIILKPSAQY